MSILKWLIRIIFWLQAFVAPVILMGLVAFAIGKGIFFIPLLIIGGIAGIVLAEYIRRKFGLETFFAGIYGQNEMDEKLKKKD
jgi:hypothetical protein